MIFAECVCMYIVWRREIFGNMSDLEKVHCFDTLIV